MNHRFAPMSWLFATLLIVASCGDNIKVLPLDAAPPPDAEFQMCGDGLVTGTEQCDDANESEDDECLNDCSLACGDGVVNSVEVCDTGIPAGMPGACPASCDDGNACTTDVVAGIDCLVECINTEITGPVDDDGCCPVGQDSTTDNDCTSVCGNGVLETGEFCDTAIATGQAGACPVQADCVDGAACTDDVLLQDGTCIAECSNPDITTPANDDGCCPPGADLGNDNDCSPMCGDGVFSPMDELCDTAIPAGMTGACPTLVDCTNMNMDPCTTPDLAGDGTCDAECTFTPITVPDGMGGDGCCPPAGNANNDGDCIAMCGNGATEPGEECDDGNLMSGDGCNDMCELEPTAFRITTLELRDPHAFTMIAVACFDITDGGLSLNGELADALTQDVDGDGNIDFNVVNLFRPLDQAANSTPMDIVFAECTHPVNGTTCSDPMMQMPIMSIASNMNVGTCLEPVAGTTSGYSPGIANAVGPCYASNQESFTVDLGGILVPLSDAQIGATYIGSPAGDLINGLLMGFVSETDADNTIIPANIPLVGGMSLSSLLPGGMGNCSNDDDRDFDLSGNVQGWWLYFNFTATQVPWTSP